ncbi:SNF2 helicase associated domain-containing protein [Ureibacillus sp. 179-F W5.1 NHS]|uniref:DEAD/DEAH box helicase n=1 Tax=Ureibacillus sp. 179-F W5.1 NHS TaxID=3374297 RepID=UPI00387A67AB
MNIKLNQKKIKEMCGTVSFKRGDSFYRSGKVTFEHISENDCEATVHGTEDFHVFVKNDVTGEIRTDCSCPKLPNFKHCCQHVAAVLIALNERKKQRLNLPDNQGKPFNAQGITEDFITLFKERTIRTSGHQRHFEKREVLELVFKLQRISMKMDENLIGIEVEINQVKVENIRDFLRDVKMGKVSTISNEFKYNPSLSCFLKEPDVILQQLIQVVDDESAFLEALPNHANYNVQNEVLLIPPSTWSGLIPLLMNTPFVKFVSEDVLVDLRIVNGPSSIQFTLEENERNGYRLVIKGFEHITFFNSYHSVLNNGVFFQLEGSDCERLFELYQMLKNSSEKFIPIHEDQIDFFLKKIVPSLKKLGDVQLSNGLTQKFMKTPLIAKLYLDRLKNRLLAGLEFHYENVVIQPLENRDSPIGPMIVRDVEKEGEILQIMEESGFTITEGGYFMQNEQLEYEFLYHILPTLNSLAQIYITSAVRTRIVRDHRFPKIRVKVQKERTDWLEFKFEMDGINDKEIKEILAALEVKQKYYRLSNGSLLSLETKEMEEIRRFLNAVPIQDEQWETTLNMPIMDGLPFLDLIEESELFTAEESFRQFVDQLLHPSSLHFEVPSSLKDQLRDYQKNGFKWMKALAHYGFGGVLADDMGLGKTIQSIAFIVSELSKIRQKKLPILILCPSSLTYNWFHELLTFAPEVQAMVMDGNKAERMKLQQEAQNFDVLITSYPLLRHDRKWYEEQSFHTIFFDEAQFFKNPATQTARTVKKLKANHKFGLTGTPVENSLEDLWSIYHVIFPQLFKGLEEYSHLSRKSIARRVRPFLLRRIKQDVLAELPKKQEAMEISDLLPEQKKLYTAYLAKLRHDTLKHLDKDTLQKNRIRILAGLTRLRQICCHPALFVDGYKGSSAKFEQLLHILEESKLSGRRVLIFSQFTKMLELIGRELTVRGQTFFYLDGQTPSEERVELCHRFNEGERDLFLISLKAGGTGLNLAGADTVILYDLWWNPAVEQQAMDRAHRMGQKNIVQVIKLVARGTIEEKMNELQEKKRSLISDILETEEKVLTSLTEEDIREILNI